MLKFSYYWLSNVEAFPYLTVALRLGCTHSVKKIMSQDKLFTLYLNTKDKDTITVALKKSDEIIDQLSDKNQWGSQVLQPLIKQILEKNNLDFADLKEIEVETGPGSYTGLRVGVSVANALAFSLGILVNGKKMETDLQY